MTETSLLPTDVGAALQLLERAYAWEDDGLTPETTQGLETLTVRAVQLASGLQRAWAACTREGSVWENGYYLSRMRAVEFLALTIADILMRAKEMLARTQQKHPEWEAPGEASALQPSLDAAREVGTKARELLQWLNRPRPQANEDMIWRSREASDRGEGEPMGDIIARLANDGPLVVDRATKDGTTHQM